MKVTDNKDTLSELKIKSYKFDIPKAKLSKADKEYIARFNYEQNNLLLSHIVEYLIKSTIRWTNGKTAKNEVVKYWHPLFHSRADPKTGEITKRNRVVVTQPNGTTYHPAYDGVFNKGMVKLAKAIIFNSDIYNIQQLIEGNLKAMEAHKFGKFVGDILEQEGIEDNEKNRKDMTNRIIEKNMADLKELIKNNPEYGKDIDPDTVQRLLREKLLNQAASTPGEGEGDDESEQKQPQIMRGAGQGEDESDVEWLKRRFNEFREYLGKSDAQTRDVVSTATYKNAGRMLSVGIPKEGIVHAYAMTWPERVRMELDIPKWNPQTFAEAKPGQHKAVPYVEALVKAGVPALLVGPTQAGKGYLSRNIAENMGLPFGSVPLSAGTSIAWLFGRNMPKGFVSTDFVRIYETGGIFLLDEMDAADANLLLGINDALSNEELANPVIDMRIPKHENFIPLAAANTFGLGADADYTGRERLDMATLERWRMGRVEVDYDRDMQESVLEIEAGVADGNSSKNS